VYSLITTKLFLWPFPDELGLSGFSSDVFLTCSMQERLHGLVVCQMAWFSPSQLSQNWVLTSAPSAAVLSWCRVGDSLCASSLTPDTARPLVHLTVSAFICGRCRSSKSLYLGHATNCNCSPVDYWVFIEKHITNIYATRVKSSEYSSNTRSKINSSTCIWKIRAEVMKTYERDNRNRFAMLVAS